MGRRRISTRRKEREEGDWTRPSGSRSRRNWRSTVTPSMISNQVSIASAMAIGSEQSRQISASLSSEFHKTIKKKVKTMELLKKAVTVKGKAIYDVVTLFIRLLVVRQQRSVDIADVFQFELSPVPPALIDEYGCLKKGDKAVLVKSLSVSVTTPCAPDVVLVDAGQVLYHVIWPVSETTGDLAVSFGTRLAHYPPVSKKIILFNIYDQDALSANDHERTRRGRANEVRLTPNTRIFLTTFYAAIPYHTASNSSTCWTVSLPMMKQTSLSAATC